MVCYAIECDETLVHIQTSFAHSQTLTIKPWLHQLHLINLEVFSLIPANSYWKYKKDDKYLVSYHYNFFYLKQFQSSESCFVCPSMFSYDMMFWWFAIVYILFFLNTRITLKLSKKCFTIYVLSCKSVERRKCTMSDIWS